MASASDRNLIVGLLAFQLDLVSKDDLVVAMGKWATEKSKTLEDVFLDSQLIDVQTHQLLAALVQKRLASSAQESGSLLKSSADVDSVRDDLRRLDDAEIDQSLSSILPDKLSTRQDAGREQTAGLDEPTSLETLDSGQGITSEEYRYRVLRPHAKGGLGEVSIAMDAELNRQVALKQMQSRYADDSEARQRFIVEAEITGSLEHPGVVPVYGLGRYADGRPYYAMRFIRGESLREACDRYHRKFGTTQHTTDQSLELRRLLNAFRDVCQTMEYAHRSSVVHRDLKPDNIMLGPFGETLVVDWGLAKTKDSDNAFASQAAPGSSRDSRSAVTATAMGSVVGTPAFMSPEQAKGLIDRISPVSDVYSLGATLYYVICGRSPFGVSPDADKSSAEVGKVLQRVGRGEFVRPRDVDPSIPKPLAAICLKAMALDPAQRYQSSARLGDDIERYLADEPILALADSAVVRLRRWMRNHQTLTITAGSLIAAATIGLFVFSSLLAAKQQELERTNQELILAEREAHTSAQQAEQRRVEAENQQQRAEVARQQAELARRQAEQSEASEQDAKADVLAFTDFLVNNILAAARPKDVSGGLGINVSVVDAIQAAEVNLKQVFKDRPSAEAIARQGIGDTWYSLGEYQRALDQFTQAEQLFQQVSGSDHLNTITARSAVALALSQLGKFEEAIKLQREMTQTLESLLGGDAKETLTARNNLALSLIEEGQYEQAISMLQEVFETSRKNHGAQDPTTLRCMNNYADALRYSPNDRRQEAIELLQQLIDISRTVMGSSHPDTLKATNNLATLYEEIGHSDQAIALLEQTIEYMTQELGTDHPTTLVTKTNLAFTNVQAGHYQAAIELLTNVVEQSSVKLTPDHPSTLNAMDILASTFDAAGQLDQAIELYQLVLDGRARVLGVSHGDTLTTKNNLAMALLAAGDATTAVPLFESVLAERRNVLAPSADELVLSIGNLAAAYIAVGQAAKALPLYQELVDKLDADSDLQTKWRVNSNLADAYMRTDQPELAIQVWEPVLLDMERNLEPGNPNLETVRQGVAIAKLRMEEFETASAMFRRAVQRQRESYAQSNAERDRSMLRGLLVYLALCQIECGEFEAAESSARESAEIAHDMLPDDWRRFNAESILGHALLKQGQAEQAKTLIESAHAALLERQDLLPDDLLREFLVPSFDRIIQLYEAIPDPAKTERFKAEKAEFMKGLGPRA